MRSGSGKMAITHVKLAPGRLRAVEFVPMGRSRVLPAKVLDVAIQFLPANGDAVGIKFVQRSLIGTGVPGKPKAPRRPDVAGLPKLDRKHKPSPSHRLTEATGRGPWFFCERKFHLRNE
jgi:hypothetical protein